MTQSGPSRFEQLVLKSTNWKDIAELVGLVAIMLGLVLVAYEIRQNTHMMRAQTRDSLTEKQMAFSEWIGTSRYAGEVANLGSRGKLEPGTPEFTSYRFLVHGIFREWENSFYQYEQGLFEQAEFEPRRRRWAMNLELIGYRDFWANSRETFSPRFRTEIDNIVSDIEARIAPD